MSSMLHVIATAIGHHFWKCETDGEARTWGMDCAREVVKAIAESEEEVDATPSGKIPTDEIAPY